MKKTTILIVVQILVIGCLVGRIWQNRHQNNSVRTVSVTPIQSASVVVYSTPSGELKHFYESKPNQVIVETPPGKSYQIQYSINDDALNAMVNYQVAKPATTFRIITLGDSFTFGQYVNTADNYPEQLEALLNGASLCPKYSKVEVINLGERGYDIRYAVERFKLRGVKYDPDLVIWLLKDDDFEQISDEMDDLIAKMAAKGYPSKQYSYDNINMAAQELARLHNGSDKILEYQLAALRMLRDYYHKPILFAALDAGQGPLNTLHKFVESDGQSLIVPINNIQLSDRFTDWHLNPGGNAKVAKQLVNAVSAVCTQ